MMETAVALQGLSDLLASERGVVFLLLMIVSLVLLMTGAITADQWIDFMKWGSVTLIASKAVTTAVETITLKKPQIPPKPPAPPKA